MDHEKKKAKNILRLFETSNEKSKGKTETTKHTIKQQWKSSAFEYQ